MKKIGLLIFLCMGYFLYPTLLGFYHSLDVGGIQSVKKNADNGDPFAQNEVGIYYERTKKDFPTAMMYYKKAADQGNPSAIYNFGKLIELEPSLLQGDKETSLTYIKKAADLGHEQALVDLAKRYLNGIGVPKDVSKGVALYTEAAHKGYGVALIDLSQLYQEGLVVEKDAHKTEELLIQTTKIGSPEGSAYPEAYYLLGKLHESGALGHPDPHKAQDFYKKATNLGYKHP